MPDPHSSPMSWQTARRLASCLLLASLVAWPSTSTMAASQSRLSPVVIAVRDAGSAVVNIQGHKSIADQAVAGASREVNGMGTGIVIDPRGYILTNHHVVDGVRQINVTLNSGQAYVATLVARDRETDLAVIRIRTPHRLPVIHIGTSEDLMTGESVIAVGNAFGYENTVTTGIISALHRNVQVNETQQYLDLIQTDASINPGNSGGPLLNIDGEMIGVNVAVRAGAQGIGFAIPVDKALEVAAEMLSIEKLDNHWHGLTAVQLDGHKGSVTIARVDRNSPADQGGLERGDEIEQIGSVDIRRPLDIERALLGRRTGDQVPMVVRRDGELYELDLAITERNTPSMRTASQASKSSLPGAITQSMDSWQRATWDTLGLALKTVPRSEMQGKGLSYNGGMRVVAVRPNSSAAEEGILAGDILVKVHRWTTDSEQDIRNLVRRSDAISRLDKVKFYIVRDNKPFFGHMSVASRPGSNKR